MGIACLKEKFFNQLNNNQYYDNYSKKMKSTPNYEITSNPKYAVSFQFTPIEMRDTEEEKVNSDYVMRCLKNAYLQR